MSTRTSSATAPDDRLDPAVATAPRRRRRLWLLSPTTRRRMRDGITEGAPERSVRSRERTYRRSLAVADAAAAGGVVAVVLGLTGSRSLVGVVVAMLLIVIVAKLAGLYDRDALVLHKSTLDEAPAILQICGLYSLLIWLLHDVLLHTVLRPGQVVFLWGAGFGAMLIGRVLARRFAAALAEPERCLVIGDPQSVETLSQKLCASRVKAEIVARHKLPAAGSTRDLLTAPGVFEHQLRILDVHRVIVAPTSTDGADTLDLVRMAKAHGVRVSVMPRLLEVVGSSVEFDEVDGLTMLGVRCFGLTRSSWLLKRTFDVVGAGLLLVLLGLPMLLIAALIRLDSPGLALFRQTRVGRHGRRFEMFKFRSMGRDADARKGELRHLNEAATGLFKIADDPRVTRVGRLLRKTSLDELPQLLNVLRGEMSLVGPRPLVVDEDVMVQGLDRSRLHLTPGMTGHWQVLGSARIPMEEMVGIDYLYVANWTLWTDLKILLRTIPHVIARRSM